MRQLTETVMENLLAQYEGVIYAAMKKMGMYQASCDFFDYYQIGCLKLFEAYQTCAADPLLEENRYQFVNYASQRLRWAFIDERRREKVVFENEAEEEDVLALDSFVDDVVFKEMLAGLVSTLTTKESLFLTDRFYLGLSMTDIAKKRGVSRKTVHQWRKGLQQKAEFLKKR